MLAMYAWACFVGLLILQNLGRSCAALLLKLIPTPCVPSHSISKFPACPVPRCWPLKSSSRTVASSKERLHLDSSLTRVSHGGLLQRVRVLAPAQTNSQPLTNYLIWLNLAAGVQFTITDPAMQVVRGCFLHNNRAGSWCSRPCIAAAAALCMLIMHHS